jgi:hypothetical protein
VGAEALAVFVDEREPVADHADNYQNRPPS